jgi:hypothetical protein
LTDVSFLEQAEGTNQSTGGGMYNSAATHLTNVSFTNNTAFFGITAVDECSILRATPP